MQNITNFQLLMKGIQNNNNSRQQQIPHHIVQEDH